MKLPKEFYLQEDVVSLARQLLGKVLVTKIDGKATAGVIKETEAYRAPEDRASHAYGMRRTKRNKTMFCEGGVSYVYLCYGIHSLFNVVTNIAGMPHAVLIRALEPVEGVELMLKRRNRKKADKNLAGGPGTLSQALGITTKLNGEPLVGEKVWIEERGIAVSKNAIAAGPRIGVAYAGEDAKLPWRFQIDA